MADVNSEEEKLIAAIKADALKGGKSCPECRGRVATDDMTCRFCGFDFTRGRHANFKTTQPDFDSLEGGIIAVSYALAVLLPLVGFIMGVYLWGKKSRHTPAVIGISIVVLVLSVFIAIRVAGQ